MELKGYFGSKSGRGVLSTADDQGRVDAAIYARPQVIDEETVVFIMADRLSHKNLETNPHAAYLFREDAPGYVGKRLFLKKTGEETDTAKIDTFRRKVRCPEDGYPDEAQRFLVYFKVEKEFPLVGNGSTAER